MTGVVTAFIGQKSSINAPVLSADDLNAAFARCSIVDPITNAPSAVTLTGLETIGISINGHDYQVPLSVLLALTGTGGGGGTVTPTTGIFIADDYGNHIVDDYASALAS